MGSFWHKPACTEMSSNNVKLDGGAINLAHFYPEVGLPYTGSMGVLIMISSVHVGDNFAATRCSQLALLPISYHFTKDVY